MLKNPRAVVPLWTNEPMTRMAAVLVTVPEIQNDGWQSIAE